MTAFQIDLFLVEKLRIPVYHLSIQMYSLFLIYFN